MSMEVLQLLGQCNEDGKKTVPGVPLATLFCTHMISDHKGECNVPRKCKSRFTTLYRWAKHLTDPTKHMEPSVFM